MKRALVLGLVIIETVFFNVNANAYIDRGTVIITAETDSATVAEGEELVFPVSVDPMKDSQMEGCGMSDCPEKCGPGCLSKDGNCTCDSTEYKDYFTSVKVKASDPDIASAEFENGSMVIKGLKEGETDLNFGARLREWTGSSIDVHVTVTGKAERENTELPKVQDIQITAANEGEENQHIDVALAFDSDIAGLDTDDFTVSLAGNPVQPESRSAEMQGNKAVITLKTMAIKDGTLEMVYHGTEAESFAVHAVVSPGLELETISQDKDNASAVIRVADLYHVRGIARVQLMENGEIVPVPGTEIMFIPVHGHDFLGMDEKAIAEKIVYALGEAFPEGYSFRQDEDKVIIEKTDAQESAELSLNIEESAAVELLAETEAADTAAEE